MKDSQKTEAQLIDELELMRQKTKKRGIAKTRSASTKRRLKDSEIRYRRLFETAQDGILILDAETGQITDVNPFLMHMLGYSHKEFIGKRLWEIGPFKDVEASRTAYRELQEKEYVRYENLPLETRDKRQIQVEFVSNIYKVNHSRVIQCNIRDITARKQIERQLRFHAEVLDQISDAVVVIDNKRIVRYWNKGAERLYGLSEEEASGQPLEECYHYLWFKPEDEQASAQALETRGFWSGDNIHIKRDGVRLYVQSSVSKIKDKEGEVIGLLAVIRDVTGRTELDHLKDEFIGLIAHEMRTPLTVIIGCLDTALSKSELLPQDEINELLNDSYCEAVSLSHILENLLELSRTQAKRLLLHRAPMIIEKLAKDVVKELKGQSAHQFILDFPSEIPPVEADTLRVRRILYNLLQNAVKYSPAGSKIKVFARQEPDYLVIGVRNRGSGISAADQARLFHSFQRLDLEPSGEIKGIGLGLMVCLRLVEAHGGKIWVESAPEKGSTFYFTLPLVHREA
ncbi:MAG: PAS domain S-box protein [Dehalococcoidia bacterium]|nr:PAS domain S-box protein [Dehalococcoidia bacterium]